MVWGTYSINMYFEAYKFFLLTKHLQGCSGISICKGRVHKKEWKRIVFSFTKRGRKDLRIKRTKPLLRGLKKGKNYLKVLKNYPKNMTKSLSFGEKDQTSHFDDSGSPVALFVPEKWPEILPKNPEIHKSKSSFFLKI